MNVETLRKTIETLEEAVARSPGNPDLMTHLAEAYSRLGWFNRDLRDLAERALEAQPGNAVLEEALSIICLIEQVEELVAIGGIHEGTENGRLSEKES